MVLPGAQALLGFQLAVFLTERFAGLPRASHLAHLGALAAITVGVVLLITPAAYHRIVERGEESEEFLRVASRLVVGALVAIALGLAGDVYVVFRMVLESDSAAIAAAVVSLAVILGLWFGLTLAARARRERSRPRRGAAAHARA